MLDFVHMSKAIENAIMTKTCSKLLIKTFKQSARFVRSLL